MSALRSALFYFMLILNTALIAFPVVIAMFLPGIFTKILAYYWVATNLFLLQIICGVSVKLTGSENISNKTALYVSKHQSTLETLFLYKILKMPAFVVKKELLYVPVFGWGIKKAGFIAINRKNGKNAVDTIKNQINEIKKDNRNIVVFPEGTRTPFGKIIGYKGGASFTIWQEFDEKIPVIPIALNTGKRWSKGHFITSGIVEIKILPELKLKAGADRSEFTKMMENVIETEQNKFK